MATIIRSAKLRPTALSLDKEARLILERCAPTPKGWGAFVSRLLTEHAVRIEERARQDAAYAELRDLYGLPVKEHEDIATLYRLPATGNALVTEE